MFEFQFNSLLKTLIIFIFKDIVCNVIYNFHEKNKFADLKLIIAKLNFFILVFKKNFCIDYISDIHFLLSL